MQDFFKTLTDDVVRIFKEYDKTGTNTWTAQTAMRDLPYQMGSLSKAMMQLSGDRYRDNKTDEEIKKTAADECADILAEVLFIAHGLGINMDEAWENMKKSDVEKIEERSKV